MTNNATRSRKEVFEHAVKLGFNDDQDSEKDVITEDRFFPSSYATALY